MPTIRQEIPLGIDATTETELDTNKYDGTVTYYFEATTTADLKRCSDSTTVVSLGAAGRTSFTPDTGAVKYFSSVAEGRIAIVQSGSWTKTSGSFNLYNDNAASTTSSTSFVEPSNNGAMQWWRYDSANWDGTNTFTFEVVFRTFDSMYAVSAQLEEDNGSFGSWTAIAATLLSSTSTIRTRLTANFTPTNGRHYRVTFKIANSMTNCQIFKAGIIVTQTASPTKLECYAYTHSAKDVLSTTGVPTASQFIWVDTDFSGVTATYYHNTLVDITLNITVVLEQSSGTDLTNSSITSSTAGKKRLESSAMTMPASATLQANITAISSTRWLGSWIRIVVTPAAAVFLHSKITQLNQSVKRAINF